MLLRLSLSVPIIRVPPYTNVTCPAQDKRSFLLRQKPVYLVQHPVGGELVLTNDQHPPPPPPTDVPSPSGEGGGGGGGGGGQEAEVQGPVVLRRVGNAEHEGLAVQVLYLCVRGEENKKKVSGEASVAIPCKNLQIVRLLSTSCNFSAPLFEVPILVSSFLRTTTLVHH